MGWTRTSFSGIDYWGTGKKLLMQCESWRPSRSVPHAVMVRDKVLRRTKQMDVYYRGGRWGATFDGRQSAQSAAVLDGADTEPMALCLAALRAIP